ALGGAEKHGGPSEGHRRGAGRPGLACSAAPSGDGGDRGPPLVVHRGSPRPHLFRAPIRSVFGDDGGQRCRCLINCSGGCSRRPWIRWCARRWPGSLVPARTVTTPNCSTASSIPTPPGFISTPLRW